MKRFVVGMVLLLASACDKGTQPPSPDTPSSATAGSAAPPPAPAAIDPAAVEAATGLEPEVTDGVVLWETPGHTPQDITTIIRVDDGDTVAFTHLWWDGSGPVEDPYATDPEALHAGRERVLEVATLIVPGHGPAFVPGESTPR